MWSWSQPYAPLAPHTAQAPGAGMYAPAVSLDMRSAMGFGQGQMRDNNSRLKELDEKITLSVQDSATYADLEKLVQLQDHMYERFKIKYGVRSGLDDNITPERQELLKAIMDGDVAKIRSFIKRGPKFTWNFVFPPAQEGMCPVKREVTRLMEAWCRTPLCLLVRPEEGGHSQTFLPGVSEADRHALIREVLARGRETCDPNYLGTYWSSPAVHAVLEGDVQALDILYRGGCNLEQRVEYGCQPRAAWSLVHAAASCGQVEIFQYLEKTVTTPGFFTDLDAELNSPLHTVLMSSTDAEIARLLMNKGCDCFVKNRNDRSPLSIAIESCPEVALDMLAMKSKQYHKWWSQELFWFSFDGIELPATSDTESLKVKDVDGNECTILELMVKHKRLELIMTPLVRDLVELKWQLFGSRLCIQRTVLLAVLVVSAWAASTAPVWDPFYIWSSRVFWVGSAVEMMRVVHKITVHALETRSVESPVWSLVDLACLALADVAIYQKAQMVIEGSDVGHYYASCMGLIQIFFLGRFLHMMAVFKFVGPMLISLFMMVADVGKFGFIIGAVIVGYANAFTSLVKFGLTPEEVSKIDYKFDYYHLVRDLLLAMMGAGELFDLVPALPSEIQLGGRALFWSYMILGFLILMNLLIAVLNTSYTKVDENTESEWTYRRLFTLLDAQVSAPTKKVQEYYKKLNDFNNRRTTMQFL